MRTYQELSYSAKIKLLETEGRGTQRLAYDTIPAIKEIHNRLFMEASREQVSHLLGKVHELTKTVNNTSDPVVTEVATYKLNLIKTVLGLRGYTNL